MFFCLLRVGRRQGLRFRCFDPGDFGQVEEVAKAEFFDVFEFGVERDMKVFRDDGFWDEVEYLVERCDVAVENRIENYKP